MGLGVGRGFRGAARLLGVGGRVGFGDQTDPIPETSGVAGWTFSGLVWAMFAAGVTVPLALLRPWGLRISRSRARCFAVGRCCAPVARGASGLLDGLLRAVGVDHGLTGMPYEESLGSAHPTQYTLWSATANRRGLPSRRDPVRTSRRARHVAGQSPLRCRGPGGRRRGMRILCGVWLCSVRLGAVVPVSEIDARGRPGTATCCFEHDLQLRRSVGPARSFRVEGRFGWM